MVAKAENLRLGILVSGGGSTAKAAIEAAQSGQLTGIEPAVVIASKPTAGWLEKAPSLGIQTEVEQRKDHDSQKKFGQALLEICQDHDVDLIAQLGWLKLTPANFINAFQGMIFNQHPGPLDNGRPDIGGKGMYGARVLATTLAYYWLTEHKIDAEATTHRVTPEYDEGQIISVKTLALPEPQTQLPLSLETIESTYVDMLVTTTQAIQGQLLPIEHANVIATLQFFADGKLPKFTRPNPLIPPENLQHLEHAKQLSIKVFPGG